MFYVVAVRDRQGAGQLRVELRPEHLEYWNAKGDVVKVAGAILADVGDDAVPVGSTLVIEAESEAAVRELLAGDPFTLGGVFGEEISIQRYRPAIGAWFPGS